MSGLIDPANGAFEITPSDTVDLERNTTAIYIGGEGDIKVETINEEEVTFTVVAGLVLPIQVKKVFSTGTDATAIVGLY